MKSIITQVDDFITSTNRNLWLSDGILSIYVRKSKRLIGGKYIDTFDVANISTISPIYEHKGYFKRFMEKVESVSDCVFVESIQNPQLTTTLRKNGYEIITEPYGTTNAIKFPPHHT
jgi:hypothetical protein